MQWKIRTHGNRSDLNPGANGLSVKATVFSAETKRSNGKVLMEVTGGRKPYRFYWSHSEQEFGPYRRIEAESALVRPDSAIVKSYAGASNRAFLDFKNQEGTVSWNVDVPRDGTYPLGIVYAAAQKGNVSMQVVTNRSMILDSLRFSETRPLFTGWDVAVINVPLKAGMNSVQMNTLGRSAPNIDYLRIPEWVLPVPVMAENRSNPGPGIITWLPATATAE